MSALANMIAKQKAAQEAKASEQAESQRVSSPAADGNIGSSPAGAATGGARLTFGIKKPTTPPAGSLEQILPEVSPSSKSVAQVASAAVMSLDDLNESEDAGNVSGGPINRMAFPDEIPATAPERELPEGLTEQQLAFVKSLDSIYEIVHDPELFGNMIRTIMQELQEVPDYMKLMADQDVHTMIRGLRSSMGLAKIKKAEKATKSRGAKKSPTTTAMMTTADEIFNASDW